jgi:formamidopyrimidine-DNA glycosylase
MPELPEVETSRKVVERVLRGHRLVEVIVDLEDRICFDRASPEEFKRAIEGARVTGTGRKGKYFWLELDRRPWPVFHLGMTGNVECRRPGEAFTKAWGGKRHWRAGKAEADATAKFLPFCRIRMLTEDGTEVAITDPRRFGRIRLATDPRSEPPVSKLGFDPLEPFPTSEELAVLLQRRRAPIKAVLLDQGLFAGVGNWIADEVLFQAKLSPRGLASRLTLEEVNRLRLKLLSIIRRSVSEDADYERYPRSWLFHYRWGKVEGATTAKKHAIVHETIGGRTTAWVPEIQGGGLPKSKKKR